MGALLVMVLTVLFVGWMVYEIRHPDSDPLDEHFEEIPEECRTPDMVLFHHRFDEITSRLPDLEDVDELSSLYLEAEERP